MNLAVRIHCQRVKAEPPAPAPVVAPRPTMGHGQTIGPAPVDLDSERQKRLAARYDQLFAEAN